MRPIKDFNMFPKTLRIKWKLTLWAAFLMLLLFLSFSFLQYLLIQKWDITQERQTIQKKMQEVVAYIQESNSGSDVAKSESYLDVLNEKYQLIRIVKENKSPLFTISDEVPQNLVAPKYVTKNEMNEMSPNGDRLLIFRKPIEVNGSKYTVEIVRNMEKFNNLINQILTLILIAGIASIALSLLGGRIISFQLLKPINAMIRTMKRIKENGMHERVPIKSHKDEMTELGVMFNELMDSLEKSFLQQQQFVEDASHELKTPLSIIHGHLSLINRWGKNDPKILERSIHLSLNETNRLINLVSELLDLSRVKEMKSMMNSLEKIEIKSIMEDVIENYKTIRNEYQILSTIEIRPDLTLSILKRHLEQLIIILLDNAMKYSKDDKVIKINVKQSGDKLIIEVLDYGIGIAKEDLPYVLNRFYRVDKARSRKQGGNGLGLSIAKKLLDLYEGTIEIESEYGKWTKVIVSFPISN